MPKMKENYIKFCKDSNKVVSYLVKEFELRKNAEQMSRSKVSKTGELNMSKLQDYRFTDDIFKRMTKVPKGKSHGLVMYIDWSGSMMQHMHSTIKQLLNLALFCKKVNIPFEVYAFSSNPKNLITNSRDRTYHVTTEMQVKVAGDLVIKPFSLFQLLSSKMSITEFTEAGSFLLDFCSGPTARHAHATNFVPPAFFNLSGTPLNQAIITAFHLVPKFKIDNKLEIVNTVFLTDGDSEQLSERYVSHSSRGIMTENRVIPSYNNRSILRDNKTKAFVELTLTNSYTSTQTVALLKLLKQRLQCNLIGFYVCTARDVREVVRTHTSNNSVIEQHMLDFRTNNYTYIEDCGYDEQYIIKSETLDVDDSEFDPQTNTVRGLVSSFSKYNGNKINSRVVLNRFIGLIA
jgi:hypothetical protein